MLSQKSLKLSSFKKKKFFFSFFCSVWVIFTTLSSRSLADLFLCIILLLFSHKSFPALCNCMDCSPAPRLLCPWDFPSKILEWAAISFSRDLSKSGIKPLSPALQLYSSLLNHLGSLLYRLLYGGFLLVYFLFQLLYCICFVFYIVSALVLRVF